MKKTIINQTIFLLLIVFMLSSCLGTTRNEENEINNKCDIAINQNFKNIRSDSFEISVSTTENRRTKIFLIKFIFLQKDNIILASYNNNPFVVKTSILQPLTEYTNLQIVPLVNKQELTHQNLSNKNYFKIQLVPSSCNIEIKIPSVSSHQKQPVIKDIEIKQSNINANGEQIKQSNINANGEQIKQSNINANGEQIKQSNINANGEQIKQSEKNRKNVEEKIKELDSMITDIEHKVDNIAKKID